MFGCSQPGSDALCVAGAEGPDRVQIAASANQRQPETVHSLSSNPGNSSSLLGKKNNSVVWFELFYCEEL